MARNQFYQRYNQQKMNDSDEDEEDEPSNNYS
jgi:hypothetical protein